MAKKDKDSPDPKKNRFGGIAFFLSIIALSIIGASNSLHLPALLDSQALSALGIFGFGVITGLAAASLLLQNHLGVLIHELKHFIPAMLVGNNPKGFKIGSKEGHFKYEYYKSTAHFNAMIALAPYWFPLFTAPVFFFALLPILNPTAGLLLVGCAYGMDLLSGLRDVGVHQTDFKALRGGFISGMLYVTATHVTLATLLSAWAAHGGEGLSHLAVGLYRTVIAIAAFYLT